MSDRPVPTRALVLLAVLTLLWGTNWPLFPVAVREVGVWTFRAIAVVLAGVATLALVRASGRPIAVARRHWPALVASAVCYLLVWTIASTYAAVLLPSGQAAVLGFTMPLWLVLIGAVVFGEPLRGRQLAAVALGAASVVLLMVPSFAAYAHAPAGLAAGLLSGIGWAVGTLILKRGGLDVPPAVLTGWQLLVCAVPIVPVALWIGEGPWFAPSWTTVAVIAYIALVPVGLGTVLWFSIVGLVPARVAGLSTVSVPVVAMLSGALVHGEPLGPVQWLAMACCAAALALVLLVPPAPR